MASDSVLGFNALSASTQKFRVAIPPPGKMKTEGNLEKNWRIFRRQFESFSIASHLDKEESVYKTAVLLAIIGEEATEVFEDLPFESEVARKDYDTVINMFETFFVCRKNEVYETYMFNTRPQEKEETVDAYVAVLRKMVRSCNFGALELEERMIRDRLVIGIRDDKIRKTLLEVKDLTLLKALDICRSHVASTSQVAKSVAEKTLYAAKHKSRKEQKDELKAVGKQKLDERDKNKCGVLSYLLRRRKQPRCSFEDVDFEETSVPEASAPKMTIWQKTVQRHKTKNTLEAFMRKERERCRGYRSNFSEQQKAVIRERQRLVQARYRERKRRMSWATVKSEVEESSEVTAKRGGRKWKEPAKARTRKGVKKSNNAAAEREARRQYMQEWRKNMSAEQIEQYKKARSARYYRQKKTNSDVTTSSPMPVTFFTVSQSPDDPDVDPETKPIPASGPPSKTPGEARRAAGIPSGNDPNDTFEYTIIKLEVPVDAGYEES